MKVIEKKSQRILKAMQDMSVDMYAMKRQDKVKTFVQTIMWYPERKTLAATDTAMLLVWRVTDPSLLRGLEKLTEVACLWYSQTNCTLQMHEKPEGLKTLDYKMLVPQFTHSVNMAEVDKEDWFKKDKMPQWVKLLEYACITTHTRFNSMHFERVADLTEWKVMEINPENPVSPVKLRSCNEDKLICLVMPLVKEEIKIERK